MEIKQVRADFRKLDQLRDRTRNMLTRDKKYTVDQGLKAADARAKAKSAGGKQPLPRKLSPQDILTMRLQLIQTRNPVSLLAGTPSMPDISKLYLKNMPRT